jgi:16S rRNA (cytosine1402-N4)-methyltransferase
MMTGRGARGGRAAGGPTRHIPVLLPEALDALALTENGIYIDGTFGAGGYTHAILDAADCRVLAIDRDPNAIAAGRDLERDCQGRLRLIEGRFGELCQLARENKIELADGVVFDIGVSSLQLDEAERGFSFQQDGPLDMRMSRSGPSAADIVARLSERQLADILYKLGDERRSRAIARAIVAVREKKPITRTGELVDVVTSVVGPRREPAKHPATRTFQALRIFVNDELGELARGLSGAEEILRPGGRLAVVTFHSLEDRIVKRFFSIRAGRMPRPSRHAPAAAGQDRAPSLHLVNRQPVKPRGDEVMRNPRARSARLRAAERTDAPAYPFKPEELGLPDLDFGTIDP